MGLLNSYGRGDVVLSHTALPYRVVDVLGVAISLLVFFECMANRIAVV